MGCESTAPPTTSEGERAVEDRTALSPCPTREHVVRGASRVLGEVGDGGSVHSPHTSDRMGAPLLLAIAGLVA